MGILFRVALPRHAVCPSFAKPRAVGPGDRVVVVEEQDMRSRLLSGLAALALSLGLAGPAWAWGDCGVPCAPPPVQVTYQTVTCYRPEYRTEWREVKHTVYRCVPETHEQTINETVLVPHWREEQRTETVL